MVILQENWEHDVIISFGEGSVDVTSVISTTDIITFTTHLHIVPHVPRCSKNSPSFPSQFLSFSVTLLFIMDR